MVQTQALIVRMIAAPNEIAKAAKNDRNFALASDFSSRKGVNVGSDLFVGYSASSTGYLVSSTGYSVSSTGYSASSSGYSASSSGYSASSNVKSFQIFFLE